jgi:amino acid transporter
MPAGFAFAQLNNPLAFDTLTGFLAAVLRIVISIVFPLIVLFFVFIGFKFVSASGPEDIKKAKELFLWAVIGALLVLGAEVLSQAIDATVREIESGSPGSIRP